MYRIFPGRGHLVILFATTGHGLNQAAIGHLARGHQDDFGQRVLAGGEADHMSAFDEPDIGFIGAAADLLGGKNLEELGVKSSLVEKEGETSGTTLFGSIWHASMLFLIKFQTTSSADS